MFMAYYNTTYQDAMRVPRSRRSRWLLLKEEEARAAKNKSGGGATKSGGLSKLHRR